MLNTIAIISVSLVVGYWLGSPTQIETETHRHKHIEKAERVSISGVSGGGASGGRVEIDELNTDEVQAREVHQR